MASLAQLLLRFFWIGLAAKLYIRPVSRLESRVA